MLQDLLDAFVPGGIYLAVGLTIGAALGRQLRPLAKQSIKTGIHLFSRAEETATSAYERGQDLVAEARREHVAGVVAERPRPKRRTARRPKVEAPTGGG
jgi:hypothetical protein